MLSRWPKKGLCTLVLSAVLAVPVFAQVGNERQDLDHRVVELIRTGKKAEAAVVAQQAVEQAEKQLGSEHPDLAQRLDNLAFTFRIQEKFAEAELPVRRALEMREHIFGKDDPDICQSLTNLAVLFEAQNRLSEVEPILLRGLNIRERAFGAQHPAVGQSLHDLAKLYKQQARMDEARSFNERATAIFGPAHPAAIMLLLQEGEYEKAARLHDLRVPAGDRAAAEKAMGRTFLGQVDNLRWTAFRMDRADDPQLVVLQGEATHRNDIWQLFEVDMVPSTDGWKMRGFRVLPLTWMSASKP